MDVKSDLSAVEDATTTQPESSDPAYLAWRDEKVRAALDAKEDGTATYKPLDEVAEKFGLNAR